MPKAHIAISHREIISRSHSEHIARPFGRISLLPQGRIYVAPAVRDISVAYDRCYLNNNECASSGSNFNLARNLLALERGKRVILAEDKRLAVKVHNLASHIAVA